MLTFLSSQGHDMALPYSLNRKSQYCTVLYLSKELTKPGTGVKACSSLYQAIHKSSGDGPTLSATNWYQYTPLAPTVIVYTSLNSHTSYCVHIFHDEPDFFKYIIIHKWTNAWILQKKRKTLTQVRKIYQLFVWHVAVLVKYCLSSILTWK